MDKIEYAVKRRGVRYSVHVGYLTKVEAAGLLASVATIQNDRHVIGPIEREDIVNAVENPEVLDPPPAADRWLFWFMLVAIVFPIVIACTKDPIIEIIKAVHP